MSNVMSANQTGAAALVLALLVTGTASRDSAGQVRTGAEVQGTQPGQVDPAQKLGFSVMRVACPHTFNASYRLSFPPQLDGWMAVGVEQHVSKPYFVKRGSGGARLICHYGVSYTGEQESNVYTSRAPPEGHTCSPDRTGFVCTAPKP